MFVGGSDVLSLRERGGKMSEKPFSLSGGERERSFLSERFRDTLSLA
jgi:hypothetical protein